MASARYVYISTTIHLPFLRIVVNIITFPYVDSLVLSSVSLVARARIGLRNNETCDVMMKSKVKKLISNPSSVRCSPYVFLTKIEIYCPGYNYGSGNAKVAR